MPKINKYRNNHNILLFSNSVRLRKSKARRIFSVAVTVDTRPVNPRVILAGKQALTNSSDCDLQAYMAPQLRLIGEIRKGKSNIAVALTQVHAGAGFAQQVG